MSNLSDKTKFKQVLNIRQEKVPAPNNSNKEYRDNLIKMKQIYALNKPRTEEEVQQKINKVFDSLASTFRK